MMAAVDTIKSLVFEARPKPRPYHSLRPGLFDIRFCYDLLANDTLEELEDDEHRAFFQLVRRAAASSVWTYSEPGDGSLPDIEIPIARMLRVPPGKWEKMKARFVELGLIRIEHGRIYLAPGFHALDSVGTERPSMPPTQRMAILRRDNFTCGYCGTKAGPFDVDHIVPIVRGGANTDDNLICACAPCNRSKGGKTLEEWLG